MSTLRATASLRNRMSTHITEWHSVVLGAGIKHWPNVARISWMVNTKRRQIPSLFTLLERRYHFSMSILKHLFHEGEKGNAGRWKWRSSMQGATLLSWFVYWNIVAPMRSPPLLEVSFSLEGTVIWSRDLKLLYFCQMWKTLGQGSKMLRHPRSTVLV